MCFRLAAGGHLNGRTHTVLTTNQLKHTPITDPSPTAGISWFGCEGRGYIFTGLNYTSMDTILNFFVQHKFNTVGATHT